MDPVTHALIGGAIYKISGGQVSPFDPQFAAIISGAMAPDIDVVFKRWGQFVYQKNHRGMSHSLLGLFGIAAVIALGCSLIYTTGSVINIFMYALLGCISHSVFDMLNSYGTRVLWPFYKKKIALNIIALFDPIIFICLLGIIFSRAQIMTLFILVLLCYILFRIISKVTIQYWLAAKYCVNVKKIKVLPSVVGLTKWHFVIRFKNYSIIGYKNILQSKIYIIRRFYDIDSGIKDKAMSTELGRFFQDFTPMYNMQHDVVDGNNIITFTDVRHYLSGNFVHHAFVVFNENYVAKEQIFCPYSIAKKVYL